MRDKGLGQAWGTVLKNWRKVEADAPVLEPKRPGTCASTLSHSQTPCVLTPGISGPAELGQLFLF